MKIILNLIYFKMPKKFHQINWKKKENILEIISKNIKKNSVNLYNPSEFYSNYFSSIIGKKDIQTHENGVSTRLNKIKELIQNKSNKNKEMYSNRSNKNSTHRKNEIEIRELEHHSIT